MQPTPAQPSGARDRTGAQQRGNADEADRKTGDAPCSQRFTDAEEALNQRNRERHHRDQNIPVTEELIQRSPSEISENGIANSTRPKATMAALCSA